MADATVHRGTKAKTAYEAALIARAATKSAVSCQPPAGLTLHAGHASHLNMLSVHATHSTAAVEHVGQPNGRKLHACSVGMCGSRRLRGRAPIAVLPGNRRMAQTSASCMGPSGPAADCAAGTTAQVCGCLPAAPAEEEPPNSKREMGAIVTTVPSHPGMGAREGLRG